MKHRRARHLVPALLDATLPARLEGQVREHLEQCPSCAGDLAELEAAEGLLRRLPAALLPRDASPVAERRLAALARWAAPPPQRRLEQAAPALGAFAAAALIAVVISVGEWAPVVENPPAQRSYAALFAEAPLSPTGWR